MITEIPGLTLRVHTGGTAPAWRPRVKPFDPATGGAGRDAS